MSDQPFRPEIRTLTVRVRRVVPLGRYASFDLSEEAEFVPDPEFTTARNLSRMRENLIRHVDEMCDSILATAPKEEP